MALAPGLFVDARHRGNQSRFINHSCDPNCELQKWAGEALSYDYQFSTSQAAEFACHCGATKCRGTMAPQKINNSPSPKKLTKRERQRRERAAQLRAEKARARELRESNKRLSLTHRFSASDLKNGPSKSHLRVAQEEAIFLRKNALKGADFLKRRILHQRRALKEASHAILKRKLHK
eukprot:CAMPEP_0194586290 /NCGR_PEP_ID=MMETSP0292-20121207/18337_1 /TAXON_ID=39354 /ORGANISM="Heterosigma akashiwo, Strain CCMP2393" /LENGTH=177 /DNA_ID=CAMNT_0039442055 /DNA_START=45 /DNA_END=578 /DNA_ORIENTATION=+